MLLWPEKQVPMTLGDAPEDIPTVTPHLPDNHGDGPFPAVLICPGGGYAMLCSDYEGDGIAAWLNTFGWAGIVLRYRCSPYRHPVPLMDATRALRLLRAHARKWNLDPHHLGIMGFSAGGHLAAVLATHWDRGNPNHPDPIERQSSRPDFQVLIYPVITLQDTCCHAGTRHHLLGEHDTENLRRELSPELHVTSSTPPAFLAYSTQDHVVPYQNSTCYIQALTRHNVPVAHLELTAGDHGLGCGQGPQWEAWQQACRKWLRQRM